MSSGQLFSSFRFFNRSIFKDHHEFLDRLVPFLRNYRVATSSPLKFTTKAGWMTIIDYRWSGTAQGWAYHAAKDEEMAQWLAEVQQCREQASR